MTQKKKTLKVRTHSAGSGATGHRGRLSYAAETEIAKLSPRLAGTANSDISGVVGNQPLNSGNAQTLSAELNTRQRTALIFQASMEEAVKHGLVRLVTGFTKDRKRCIKVILLIDGGEWKLDENQSISFVGS